MLPMFVLGKIILKLQRKYIKMHFDVKALFSNVLFKDELLATCKQNLKHEI